MDTPGLGAPESKRNKAAGRTAFGMGRPEGPRTLHGASCSSSGQEYAGSLKSHRESDPPKSKRCIPMTELPAGWVVQESSSNLAKNLAINPFAAAPHPSAPSGSPNSFESKDTIPVATVSLGSAVPRGLTLGEGQHKGTSCSSASLVQCTSKDLAPTSSGDCNLPAKKRTGPFRLGCLVPGFG